jgi:hypothetical protein
MGKGGTEHTVDGHGVAAATPPTIDAGCGQAKHRPRPGSVITQLAGAELVRSARRPARGGPVRAATGLALERPTRHAGARAPPPSPR